MTWQPIETAPRDGTPVLVANAKGAMTTARWEKEDCGTFVYEAWYLLFGGLNAEETEIEWPTHWMPLPAPPTE